MINLITIRRKIATHFALSIALLCSSSLGQDVDLSMTDSPLLLDEVPVSVMERQVYGPELPPESQDVLPVVAQEELPVSPLDENGLPELPAEVDVLTRGPLHEAFATAHQSNPEPSPIVAKAPPELIDEVPPEYKPDGKNVQWIPGYWAWDDSQNDFIWISGVWRDVPPERRWVPGYWEQSGSEHRWVSGFWAEETQQELGYLPEPPPTIDQGPSTAAPGENYFYVPGNWEYRDNRYRWLSGHWQPVVGNWIWIPARYIWTPRGCIYRSGYWDYEFDRRGTCFAPVYFKRPVYLASTYYYRPSFAINLNIDFLTHLFVRPRCGHYYYGDWYSANFVNFGYRPWVSYRSHYRSYDPLLTYYRCRRFDSRFNTVQYLSRQHQFFALNRDYRPRPTFVAQFNFVNNLHRHQLHGRQLDYLRNSNYVRTYSNVLRTAQRNAERRHRDLQVTSNRLQRELQRQRVQYRKIKEDELRSNRRQIEQLAKLQRDRRKNEIKLVNHQANIRTSSKRHRTLKLPPQVSNKDLRTIRGEFPTAKGGRKSGQLTIDSDRSRDLRKAIDNARKNAAKQERERRERERKVQTEISKRQRDRNSNRGSNGKSSIDNRLAQDRNRELNNQASENRRRQQAARDRAKQLENQKVAKQRNSEARRQEQQQQQRRRNQLSQLANQRDKERNDQANPNTNNNRNREQIQRQLERQRQTAEQNRQQQKNRQSDRTRQLGEQQQKLQQRNAKDRNRQRQLEQQRRANDAAQKAKERQQRDQQRRQQIEQTRRSQEQSRQAKDAARRAQQQQAQKARQDAANRARQKAQQDAARRAQQKAQRDAARRTQQDAARRAQQQRQRQATQRAQQQRQAAQRAQQKRNRTKPTQPTRPPRRNESKKG